MDISLSVELSRHSLVPRMETKYSFQVLLSTYKTTGHYSITYLTSKVVKTSNVTAFSPLKEGEQVLHFTNLFLQTRSLRSSD